MTLKTNRPGRRAAWLGALMLLCGLSAHAQQGLILENETLSAEFDPASGALVGLTSKQTGWNIVRRPQLGQSFQILIPLPDRRYNNALGKEQRPPVVRRAGNTLTFTWEGIRPEHLSDTLPIRFTGTVTLDQRGLVYAGQLENRSTYDVEYICWPYLGELSVPDTTGRLLWQTLQYGQSYQRDLYPWFGSPKGYWGIDHPTQLWNLPECGLVMVRSDQEGFSVICDDHLPARLVQCIFELVPGALSGNNNGGRVPLTDSLDGQPARIEFKTNHVLYNHPGEISELTPVMLHPFQGSWHHGADHYKAWRSTWHHAPQRPAWLNEVHAWQQIQINSSEDRLNFRYADLPDYARECKENGVAALQLTGWNLGGQDRNNPSHDTDPRLGTFDELKTAIAACERMGVRIILFNKYTWADISTPWYRDELKRYAARDPYGDPYLSDGYQYNTYTQLGGINTRRFAVMCPLSDRWRRIARAEFAKNLALGASGILYDENQHHGGAQMCFADDHGHPCPAFVFAGDDALAREFRADYQQQNPDFVMLGEGIYDMQSQYYHASYLRADIFSVPLHRYIDPELPIIMAVAGHDGRNHLNACLKNKYIISYEPRFFKGRLSEAPQVVAYGRKIDALRERYPDFLWEGIYRDTLGATVSGNHTVYSVFQRRSDGKRAVVVLNASETEGTTARVALPNGGSMEYATPDAPERHASNGTLELDPQGAAVFFER